MRRKDKSVLYSNKDDEHITPPNIVARLARTFKIQYDPCPSPNYLHPEFERENRKRAEIQKQEGHINEVFSSLPWPNVPIFINPPYSDLDHWIDWAIRQFDSYSNNPIVLLLPSRTDRPWFERIFNAAHAIGFVRLRLKFKRFNEETGEIEASKYSAPFPSMFCILERNVSVERNQEIIDCLDGLNCVSLVLKDVVNNNNNDSKLLPPSFYYLDKKEKPYVADHH